LDSSAARRSISFSISFVRFSLSCARLCHSFSRLSLSSALICASAVGCQFNLANQRRHGGKEERNSDLLINLEAQESEEIDMAVGSEKSDQDDQQTRPSVAGSQVGGSVAARGGAPPACEAADAAA
jgi:hypothetical protein